MTFQPIDKPARVRPTPRASLSSDDRVAAAAPVADLTGADRSVVRPHASLSGGAGGRPDRRRPCLASRRSWQAAWLGLVAQDKLALSLVAGLLVGLGLSRVRGGVLGRVMLGLAFADLSWYTVSGAIWNIVQREGLAAVVVPAWLGACAVAGLIAVIASIVNRAQPDAGRTGAIRVGSVAAACFALAIAVSAVLGRVEKASAAAPNTIDLTAENMAFSNKTLDSGSGQVTVRLNNHDLFWHAFTIDALGVDLKVPVNGDELVTFSAAPGTYEFYCTIPGHAQVGMRGTLIVR